LDAGITLIVFDPSPKNPANIHIYFIFPEVRNMGLILLLIVLVYALSNVFGGLRKTFIYARVTFRKFRVIQGH